MQSKFLVLPFSRSRAHLVNNLGPWNLGTSEPPSIPSPVHHLPALRTTPRDLIRLLPCTLPSFHHRLFGFSSFGFFVFFFVLCVFCLPPVVGLSELERSDFSCNNSCLLPTGTAYFLLLTTSRPSNSAKQRLGFCHPSQPQIPVRYAWEAASFSSVSFSSTSVACIVTPICLTPFVSRPVSHLFPASVFRANFPP